MSERKCKPAFLGNHQKDCPNYGESHPPAESQQGHGSEPKGRDVQPPRVLHGTCLNCGSFPCRCNWLERQSAIVQNNVRKLAEIFPTVVDSSPKQPEPWNCKSCSTANTGDRCTYCGATKDAPSSKPREFDPDLVDGEGNPIEVIVQPLTRAKEFNEFVSRWEAKNGSARHRPYTFAIDYAESRPVADSKPTTGQYETPVCLREGVVYERDPVADSKPVGSRERPTRKHSDQKWRDIVSAKDAEIASLREERDEQEKMADDFQEMAAKYHADWEAAERELKELREEFEEVRRMMLVDHNKKNMLQDQLCECEAQIEKLWEFLRWRPIDTAPKTGEHILGARLTGDGVGFGICGGKTQSLFCVVHWWSNPGEEGWYDSFGGISQPMYFTHWQPLREVSELAALRGKEGE